ncbi:uncharacterized protein LAJ45_09592 [Morchella importuna]|uniref:uncharacterized protein n=1 Tax=Morchella importuna TaxID=1174673 RepID=UPI001E8DCBEA|nr:uncharacterized protein LAJ45_09592 [Morchella importuna]KAH8146399.1 hypothetical protein LAJ45_09592 [Morchella importuna]
MPSNNCTCTCTCALPLALALTGPSSQPVPNPMLRLLRRLPTTRAQAHRLYQRLRQLLIHHTRHLRHLLSPSRSRTRPKLLIRRMAPVIHPPTRPGGRQDPRIILYHQTHYIDGKTYVSLLPLLKTSSRRITHLILAAVHLNAIPGEITLNDHPFAHPSFDPLWDELTTLKDEGIKVLFMLGGAAQGTFTRLDTPDPATFEAYYAPLKELIEIYAPHGIDLDVEEPMSLTGIVRLIDRLKADFGADFIITLAPVAAALQGGGNISGFSYEALEAARGASAVVRRGWRPEKVVAGIVTNGRNGAGWVGMETLQTVLMELVEMFPGFGGVMGWEYFNGLPGDVGKPWEWAENVGMAVECGVALADALVEER